jgi:hypothetical protein
MRQLTMAYFVFPGDSDHHFLREEPPPPRREVVTPPAGLDDLIKQLGQIMVAMARLGYDDQKRMTNFILAAGSLSMAKTRLTPNDQEQFEAALRDAVQRQRGG